MNRPTRRASCAATPLFSVVGTAVATSNAATATCIAGYFFLKPAGHLVPITLRVILPFTQVIVFDLLEGVVTFGVVVIPTPPPLAVSLTRSVARFTVNEFMFSLCE